MKNYIFHYRTMAYNRQHKMHIQAANFQDAMSVFLRFSRNRLFKTFRVEFL